MAREKELIGNTFILGIGSIFPKLTEFILLPIYTTMLTRSDYGIYDLIKIFILLLIPLITLQIERAAFRYLIDLKKESYIKNIISNVYIFVVLLSSIIFIILAIVLKSIEIKVRILTIIYLFFKILISVTRQVVRGLGNNKVFSISNIIETIINVLLTIIFLWVFEWGLLGLLVSLALSVLISLTYLINNMKIYSYISLNNFDKDLLREMLKYSLPLVPNSIFHWVLNLSDRLIITSFLGIEINAIYAIANKFPNLIKLIFNNFNMAWQESASLACKDDDSEIYFSKIFDYLYNFLIGIIAVLIGIMPIMFSILVKGNYDKAYYQIPILIFGIFFSILSSYYGGIYIALKRTKKLGIGTVLTALNNIIINFLFIKKIGLYAASISTVLSYFFLFLYRTIDLRKTIKFYYKGVKKIFYLVVVITMALLSYKRILLLDIINLILGICFATIINWRIIKEIIYKPIKGKFS